jgi:photosystem II stability/assembly factor-like uncharacterized protein
MIGSSLLSPFSSLSNQRLTLVLSAAALVLLLSQVQAQTPFWQQANGPEGGSVYSHGSDGENVLYASTLTSIFKSTNRGSSWSRMNLGNVQISSITVNAGNEVFLTTTNRGILRSTDGGTSWMEVNNGIAETSIRSLAIGQANSILAGSNTGKLYHSTNGGQQWNLLHAIPSGNRITTIAVNGEGHIFLGTFFPNGGVFRQQTTALGGNWWVVFSRPPKFKVST